METISLISTHPGAGLTTVAVNLGTALARLNKKVLINSQVDNPKLNLWLNNPEPINVLKPASDDDFEKNIFASRLGIDLLTVETADYNTPESISSFKALIQNLGYDYYLHIFNSDCSFNLISNDDKIFICTDLIDSDEIDNLIELDKKLKNHAKCADLIIPVKLDPKEWEKNSTKLLALGEYFGYEIIADMIPACERIHDLAKDGKSIWDINQLVLQNAFRQLVDFII